MIITGRVNKLKFKSLGLNLIHSVQSKQHITKKTTVFTFKRKQHEKVCKISFSFYVHP